MVCVLLAPIQSAYPCWVEAFNSLRVICRYSECLPILNALRTEGLNGLLKGLVEAGDGEASQIQPLARSGKTTIQIASELAGTNKESCDATNANQSQVWSSPPIYK